VPNTLIKKYAPMNVSKVAVPSSDKMFYTAGGQRDYPLWQVVNEFGSSYFSGLDVSVYFGDIFVDEVVQISFGETENVKPIFGYASYVFDCVAHGARIVQGTFAINFKDAGYIPTMLGFLSDPKTTRESLNGVTVSQLANTARLAKTATTQEASIDAAQANQLFTDSLKQARDWPTQLAISRDLSLEDIVNNAGSNDPDRYRRVMENLKKEHWGEYKTAARETEADTSLTRPKYQLRTGPMSPGFDIIIKYGQPEDYYDSRPGWGTIECIKDCHITGFQKAIDDSGRNVIEVYNFLARTLA
jgi:hypothetical protein